MARTTPAAVQGVLGPHYDGQTSLTPFIDTANAIVERIAEQDADSIMTSVRLEIVERWLAGHFYAHADQLRQTESAGGKASATYQGQTGMNLSSTQYGQSAMLLDFTGLLAKLSKQAEEGGRRKVGFQWLGLPPSEQTDYVDRD